MSTAKNPRLAIQAAQAFQETRHLWLCCLVRNLFERPTAKDLKKLSRLRGGILAFLSTRQIQTHMKSVAKAGMPEPLAPEILELLDDEAATHH